MDGTQKTVYLGLLAMAEKVKAGDYGKDDDAFHGDDDEDGLAFLADMCDNVTDNIQ
jgi:hypothetical protein